PAADAPPRTDRAAARPPGPLAGPVARFLEPARRWLDRDVPALPVDVFRVLVGLLAATHFVRLLVEYPRISAPEGLIDHALTLDIWWFTRLGLFQPGIPGWKSPSRVNHQM